MLHLYFLAKARIENIERGAGMAEYALLVALVGVLLVGALATLRGGIEGALNTAAGLM